MVARSAESPSLEGEQNVGAPVEGSRFLGQLLLQ